jgi:hypothetical protein
MLVHIDFEEEGAERSSYLQMSIPEGLYGREG